MIEALALVGKQWFARIVSLCVVGPICAGIASGVVAPDGSRHTTFLTSHSMGSGIVALAMVLGLTMVMGIVIGRGVDRREGFLNIAFVLGWVAWTSGRMGEMYRFSADSGTLIKVAIETLIIALAMLIAMMLMTKPDKAGSEPDDEVSRFDCSFIRASLFNTRGIASMFAALASGLVISYLLGQSDLPGQSTGVGFFVGIGAGLIGTLVSTSMGKGSDQVAATPFAPIMIGVMLCGVLGPVIGMIQPGSGGLLALIISGHLPGYLIVSPIAWSMGALLGVPIGHSWVEHSAQQVTNAQAKPA
ncbi:hypothetical protein COB72_04600 [bacterium]|nr:MAG: hypothetical protein COB72_04600 [bacterium]